MIDMRPTVIPKSDQLNADSLIGGPITIKVTKVSLLAEADQPIAISYEGDGGKPYKPAWKFRAPSHGSLAGGLMQLPTSAVVMTTELYCRPNVRRRCNWRN